MQMVRVQPEPEFQLGSSRFLGCRPQELRLGPWQGRVSSGTHVVLVLPWLDAAHSFVLQLISLAGLHLNAVTAAELAARFKTDGMLAYVDLIQKKEKEKRTKKKKREGRKEMYVHVAFTQHLFGLTSMRIRDDTKLVERRAHSMQ